MNRIGTWIMSTAVLLAVSLVMISGATIVFVSTALPHEMAQAEEGSWIAREGHKNANGESCCGKNDCEKIEADAVRERRDGFLVFYVFGTDVKVEIVPHVEAKTSKDGHYWRCRYPDGKRRCFFVPPGST